MWLKDLKDELSASALKAAFAALGKKIEEGEVSLLDVVERLSPKSETISVDMKGIVNGRRFEVKGTITKTES